MPVFFAQGIDRGVLQGQIRFLPLAASYQAEMWVRLIVALGLVALGFAINGAVAGLSLSFLATWLVARRVRTGLARGGILPRADRRAVLAFAVPVSAALVGQVLINNSDVLIVKHFFAAAPAGRYAALALIGRIIFFATWSIGTTMFPIVAQRQHRGQRHRQVLWISFGVVGLASLLILGATLIAPRAIVRILFGPAYLATSGAETSIASLLWLYALATSLYALANVVITYRLSTGAGGRQHPGPACRRGPGGGALALPRYPARGGAGAGPDHGRAAGGGAGLGPLATPPSTHTQCAGGGAVILSWRHKLAAIVLPALLALSLWRGAFAVAPIGGFPAHQQIKDILQNLRDGGAEHADGAYIPGVGAVITMDLLRGPNTLAGKAPDVGVRDWLIYLLGTFGPRLTAVPRTEIIALSVDYYDYGANIYHQLVVLSRAAGVADPGTYAIWLDGKALNAAAGQTVPLPIVPPATVQRPAITPDHAGKRPVAAVATPPIVRVPATTPVIPGAGPTAIPTGGRAPSTVAPVPSTSTTIPLVLPTAGPLSLPTAATGAGPTPMVPIGGLDFRNLQATARAWIPLTGVWSLGPTGYQQADLGKFDLVSYFYRPLAAPFRLTAQVRFLAGQMGAGLIFDAPQTTTRFGAQMISFAGNGTYLQWGVYDRGGVFNYQGGRGVPSTEDGAWHQLSVTVQARRYAIVLDGATMGQNIPLSGAPRGYVGLLASTSRVLFRGVRLERIGP